MEAAGPGPSWLRAPHSRRTARSTSADPSGLRPPWELLVKRRRASVTAVARSAQSGCRILWRSARSLWSMVRVKACVCPLGVARVVAARMFGRRLSDPPLHVPIRSSTRGASRMEERSPTTVEALASTAPPRRH